MRMGNGYQLCSGANHTCRHRFGACPLHRPMLHGEQARAVLADLGYPVRPGSHKDATCRECGFIVHAPWCSTLAENNCGGQTADGPPCGGCASCIRKQAEFWAAHEAEQGRKLCEIGHQFGSSACCVRCGLPAPSPATAYAGFAGDVAEQCKVARAKVEADAAGFVRPSGPSIVRAGWYHVGRDTRDPGDKNVYDRYTREDSRASVWQDAMSGKWHAGPWTLTCFSTVNWGVICDDAQSAMACVDRELQEQDTLRVAGKLTAEECSRRYHARSKGEACPCGSCKGP